MEKYIVIGVIALGTVLAGQEATPGRIWSLSTPENLDQRKAINDPNTIEVNFNGSDGSKWKVTGWKKVK